MMSIEYKSKIQKPIIENNIKAILVEYEISKEDLQRLSKTIKSDTYKVNSICLYKDNVLDLIIDDIEHNRIVEGVIREDNKAYLDYFIVDKGLHELIMALSFNN